MPELRWALALLGVLFLGGLAWWELRRPRQGLDPHAPRDVRPPPGPAVHREPSLTLPEIRAPDPLGELPAVEIVDDSLIGLRADGDRAMSQDTLGETLDPDEEVEPIVPVLEAAAPREAVLDERAEGAAGPADPVVDWPQEAQRRVIALRVVAPGERFSGRAVRQALAAEGFVLGKFAIFHRCGPDGRAVVSAANLTKPGTFDLDSIDMQRLGGLNLFVVLPGPLPSLRAFDELVACARNLCERLEGALQDDSGEPLTPLRTAAIRESLAHDG